MPTDAVNPEHYKGVVECIDALQSAMTESELRGFCKGNALKYLWREGSKNKIEDLRKARWYLQMLLHLTDSESEADPRQMKDVWSATAKSIIEGMLR